jgi:hypothetical protein
MLKAVSLWVGSLLVPGNQPTNEMIRIEIAQHMRTMIGANTQADPSDLPLEYFQKTPLKFCRLLINDLHHELIIELKACGITLEQLETARAFHKQKILEEDYKRRLKLSEKPGNRHVKKIVSELAARWHMSNRIRVIDYRGASCIGCARLTELFFDEEWWENEFENNTDVLRFIAGHELHHILVEDLAVEEALCGLQKKIKNKKAAQKALNTIRRINKLEEVQADIESALDSSRSLKGYVCWTSHDIKGCGDVGGEAHPLTSQRFRLASLLQQLNNLYQAPSSKKRKIE